MGRRHQRIRWDKESREIRKAERRAIRRRVRILLHRGVDERIERERKTRGWQTH